MVAGVGFGSALLTATLVGVRLSQTSAPPGEPSGPAGALLTAGLLGAIGVAALFAWRRTRGLATDAHRAAVAVLAAFGTLGVVFLTSWRIERAWGLAGLAGLGAVCALLGVLGDRWAGRGRETGNEKQPAPSLRSGQALRREAPKGET